MNYEQKIKELEDKKSEISGQIRKVAAEWVDAECSVKIGDEVVITGYSHRGKKIIVDRVFLKESFGEYFFRAAGFVLKKDGTAGVNRGEWNSNSEFIACED